MRKKFCFPQQYLFLFLWLIPYCVFGRSAEFPNIDSLLYLYPKQVSSAKCGTLNQIACYYQRTHLDSSLHYARSAYKLALYGHDRGQQAEALKWQGVAFYYASDWDSALYYIEEANHLLFARDSSHKADVLFHLGNAYAAATDWEAALDAYTQVLEYYPTTEILQSTFHHLSIVYRKQGAYEEALEHAESALPLAKELKSHTAITDIYTNLAVIHQKMEEYEGAEEYAEKALDLAMQDHSKYAWIRNAIKLGGIYMHQERYEDALTMLEEALTMARHEKMQSGLVAAAHNTMGDVFFKLRNYRSARLSYEAGLKQAVNSGVLEDGLVSLDGLLTVYELQGNHRLALKTYRDYVTLKDSIAQLEEIQEGKNIRRKLNLLEGERDEQSETVSKQRTAIGRQRRNLIVRTILLILVALLGGLSFWQGRRYLKQNRILQTQYETIQLQNKRLEDANEEWKQFAYIVSHDLKEPLRTIGSYVSLLKRRYGKKLDDDAQDFIQFAVGGVKQLKMLLDDLLAYVSVRSNNYQAEEIELDDVVSQVLRGLRHQVKENDAVVDVSALPSLRTNRSLMLLLFQNLISNGIKFKRDERPLIKVYSTASEEGTIITVSDNGKGIDEKYQKKIFSMFYRLDRSLEGTGIGLSICHKIVQLHQGRIWMDSQVGEGTSFHFILPHLDKAVPAYTDLGV